MITLEQVVLLASILASYGINWAYVLAEQIHEFAVWTNTLLSFPILIHRLCNEEGIRVNPHREPHIEVMRTMDLSLIKANENPVALQRAASLPIPTPFP